MTKHVQKIQTASYIHIGDKLVNVDVLNEQQKIVVGTHLSYMLLNELLVGRVTFELPPLPPIDQLFEELLRNNT